MFQKRWADHNYYEEGGESIAMVQRRNMEVLNEILSDNSFGCEDSLRIIDWTPYIIELDFEGDKLVGKHEHCHVEKEFKGNQRADKK